jgi:glycosyltransferase involved in cell wall biosynthesis
LIVCLVSPSALPVVTGTSRAGGGAELDVWHIARALALDPRFDPCLAAIGDAARTLMLDGVRIVEIPRYRPSRTRRGYFARYCLRVIRTLSKIDADVYLCKGASLEAVLCFAAARLGRRRRYVFRFQHDWETAASSLIEKIFGGQRLLARMFMQALERADVRVTQTYAQQQLLADGFRLSSVVLYNSHPIPPAAASAGKRTAVWVGRAAAYKRPEIFLELARRLPHHPFVMVATADTNFPDVFERLRSESVAIPNLTFVGGATRDEVEALVRAARVSVLTSKVEGFPNVVVEAWKNSTPVASLRVDPDGLIRQSGAGFVADDDVDALVDGVERLLRDDNCLADASAASYALARERLDIARTIETYKQLFLTAGDGGAGLGAGSGDG